MEICPDCGTEVTGTVCGSCGRSAPAAGRLRDNVAGAACYLLGVITGVLFLVLANYSRNREVRFHAFQSIFLHAGLIALVVGLRIIESAMNFPNILLMPARWVLFLGSFEVWALLMIKTFQGRRVVLPIIGPLALRQAD